MCENIESCCRICLDVESDHVSILGDPTIQLQLKACLAMTISANDNLPKKICTSCVAQLGDFYNFQLNARCSLDWLEYSIEEHAKKSTETKVPIQPLPDSEYNSDSLLEFLNNTANIEEYLNNLGKEDIPSIVSMLDRNQENSLEATTKIANTKSSKQPSPKKKDTVKTKSCIKMEIDVLDSDIEIVKEIIMKEIEPKKANQPKDKNSFTCFACKTKFDNINKMSQHLGTCDYALRTCIHCSLLFDSKIKMQQHSVIHNNKPLTCNCGKQFLSKEKLKQHHKTCYTDYNATMGYIYRCKQCKETFKERFQLYKHAKEHVMKMEEKICDICGQILMGNEALEKHRKDVHEKDKNSVHRCKICRYTTSNYNEIYLHVQSHCSPPKPDDRHLCESCGRSFATRASLLRHVLLHVMEHKCNICQKTFSDVQLRDKHVLAHIESTICEKCGQNVSSYTLEVHSCM